MKTTIAFLSLLILGAAIGIRLAYSGDSRMVGLERQDGSRVNGASTDRLSANERMRNENSDAGESGGMRGQRREAITAAQAEKFSLSVCDDVGHGIEGVSVWAIPVQEYVLPPRREVNSKALCDELATVFVVCDETGHSCLNLPSGHRFVVVSRKEGFATGFTVVDDSSESTSQMVIVMSKMKGVSGIVLERDGMTPVSGAFVTATPIRLLSDATRY